MTRRPFIDTARVRENWLLVSLIAAGLCQRGTRVSSGKYCLFLNLPLSPALSPRGRVGDGGWREVSTPNIQH